MPGPSLTSRFQKLFGLETKANTLATPDQWFYELFGAAPASSGVVVTPRTAMTCAPVRRAVQLISESIGQLPIHIYETDDEGAIDRAPDHPACALLNDAANDWTPASKLREEITRDALLYRDGGFAFINRVDGVPFELIRFDPEINPVIVTYVNTEPFYRVGDREIPRADMLHIPSPALHYWGLVHDARDAIGLALVMERHASRLFGNAARPSGILSLAGKPGPLDVAKAAAAWNATHGGDKSGGTAVLPVEATWQGLSLNSVDAQFLELRKFQINEIARIFGVPPHLLYETDMAIKANVEQLGQEFISYSLMNWISRWEGEARLKLFTKEERAAGLTAKFYTDGFARADQAARYESYTKAIAARVLNPNEVRALENRPPYAGGDEFINPNVQTAALT